MALHSNTNKKALPTGSKTNWSGPWRKSYVDKKDKNRVVRKNGTGTPYDNNWTCHWVSLFNI